MKQINLMTHLKNDKAEKNYIYEPMSKHNDYCNTQELTNARKRKLCDDYLIPLLSQHFIDRKTLIGDIFRVIIYDEKTISEMKEHIDISIGIENAKNFLYQTCLNFVDDYSDLILTQKFNEQTKKEMIINAFTHSGLNNQLANIIHNNENFDNGCYITIDLHKICKDG